MLLAGKLTLHDVRDVGALAARVASTSRLKLSWHEREDLEAYLIATAWELSTRYEPGAISFSTWATTTLKLRTIDWYRACRGRTVWKFADTTHERARPELVSLDERTGLGDTLPSRAGDPADDRSTDLAWLLNYRGGSRARDLDTLGLRPPRRAA
jgi:DNA-directed RNA polymerase specialized sigma24 family protein